MFAVLLWVRRASLLVTLAVAALSSSASVAAAGSGFGVRPDPSDSSRPEFLADVFEADHVTPDAQAGATPDVAITRFAMNRQDTGPNATFPDQNIKDLRFVLPAGFVGNPQATPRCERVVFNGPGFSTTPCPADTQVGTSAVTYTSPGGSITTAIVAVYSLQPRVGDVAEFAFRVIGTDVHIIARVENVGGEYRVVAGVRNSPVSLPVLINELRLWGVPGAASHDAERTRFCAILGEGSNAPSFCLGGNVPVTGSGQGFWRNPTYCGPRLATTLQMTSWQNPTVVNPLNGGKDYEAFTRTGAQGCELVPFAPTASITPDVTAPDTPTGLKVELKVPQNQNPDVLATAHLRNVKVTLPVGMSINPGGADGLGACADVQLGLNNDQQPSCPESAKIGTVTATTPVLTEQLSGDVYLRSQASDDPESGDMFRMALVLQSKERGIVVKLPGAIRVNKDTGRIVTEFKNNPQLPVEDITLSLKSGPRAPLATPATCGEKTFDVEMTSWSGKTVDTSSSFTVPCSAGLGAFAPSLSAGTTTPIAGAFSPFALSIAKPDGNAAVSGLSMVLPAGLLAHLKGNLGTQVGTVKAYAGPGSNPFMLPGQVFLEGQYGDAPFSLRVVVPAKAGPFDLGTVEVRQKIYVDPIDAHVTVVSDPIPTIVKGVPVRLQRLDVSVDKAGFIVNPTSCAAKTISSTLSAIDGRSVPITNHFQAGDCTSLGVTPKLALSLSGKGQTKDGGHPAISATLTQPVGQANLKKVVVRLPLSLALDPDNSNSNGLCSFVEGSKPNPVCPASSVVGKATAVSPILNEPLSGPVYFVKNERKDPKSGRSIKTTPKLVIPLTGENGVKLTLTGTSSVPDNEHLVTTFDNIPDAAVSSFKLDINGGKKGILVISSADICKSTQIADQQIDGQNTKRADADIFIQTPSCPTKIITKKVTAKAVTLKIGGLGAGKVTVSGKGIKKTTKTITKSTVATIAAKRSGKARPTKVTVTFKPAGGGKAKTTSARLP